MDAPLRWVKDASSITILLPKCYQNVTKMLPKCDQARYQSVSEILRLLGAKK